MFNHHAFRDRVALSGVNSINWGRILAQITYYFAAASVLGRAAPEGELRRADGQFRRHLRGLRREAHGATVERLVVATNSNDILARTHATGAYEMQGVAATTSPSMDIQISSNFERYLFEAAGRDPALVRNQMAGLAQSRRFSLSEAQVGALRREFAAARAGEDEIAATIRRVKAESGYLMDTHYGLRRDRAGEDAARRRDAGRAAGDGPSPQVPGRHGGDHWRAAWPAAVPRRPADGARADHPAANDLAAVERFVEDNARAVRGAAA